MWKHFLRLFVSNACYGCDNTLLPGEEGVCLGCLSKIEATRFHLQPQANELYFRLAGRIPLTGAAALFYFDKEGTLQRLIEALKYKDSPQLGEFLGRYYGHLLQESGFSTDVEAIIPVPLHRLRQASRGYNQAECFANGLSQELKIPVLTQGIRRTRRTLTQTRKGAGQRWDNVKEAFAVEAELPPAVLVVDDVITTGATLESLIRALTGTSRPPEQILVAGIGVTRKH